MGAAAGIGMGASIAASSEEELKSFLGSLSKDDRAKVLAALEGTGATKEQQSITVSIARLNGEVIVSVEVGGDDEVNVLEKAVADALGGERCQLFLNGRELLAHAPISAYGTADGDIVSAVIKPKIVPTLLSFDQLVMGQATAELKADGSVVTTYPISTELQAKIASGVQ